ncbi:hypothetical protein MKL09_31455 [Methylobacterium sp. J-048]|uniref:hypothetical protein n=1 Tax=Methylobacterium sp. J-048 TaxID=2836635 RepID=UPI001FBB0471|nr:hypothetical protein [Methylobacterium sp. J-048]MCJ2061023.1 hypothetical protein [Methylobacterium sp. J-048]
MSRPAALGAILAAPLTGGVVMALPSGPKNLPDHEAQFLAVAPRMVALLDEYDRLWALSHEPYAIYEQARGRGRYKPEHEKLPEWFAYIEARRPADDLDAILEEMYEPYRDLRLVSFEAIKLRHRYGMTFDWARDDLLEDLDAIWGRKPCA